MMHSPLQSYVRPRSHRGRGYKKAPRKRNPRPSLNALLEHFLVFAGSLLSHGLLYAARFPIRGHDLFLVRAALLFYEMRR